MKAYYSKAYGNSEVSAFGELPDPVAGPGQILVEIKAVTINPVDWKIKQGAARLITGFRFPRIFGADFSGIVRETGPGVTSFSQGQRVYGSQSILFDRRGSLAELRAVNEDNVRLIPEGMSFNEAASLPIAALTALNGLRKCGVGKGTVVLANGGTGGVGHFAIQIARARGAVVTATCSEGNRELAKSFGADEVMGYSREEMANCNTRFDAIMDAYGKMNLRLARHLLKRGGTYASTLFIPPPYLSILITRLIHGRRLTSANMRKRPEDWQELEKLYAEGKLKPFIENIFSLENAADAFELAVNGKPRGKIIVSVP
jgi:NADPH:quinone reductase-like Zn-dependent oxidoreductase